MKNSINNLLIAVFLISVFLISASGCATEAPGAAMPPSYEGENGGISDSAYYSCFDFVWNEAAGGYFVYEKDDNPYTDIIIPSQYNGKYVVGIGKHAFGAYSKLKRVVIPESIKIIEMQAFNYCDYLEEIDFGNNSGLAIISDYAFYNCKSLERIEIPARVEEIGYRAFSTCPALADVTVAEGNERYCSVNGVVYTKDMKTLIAIAPALAISLPSDSAPDSPSVDETSASMLVIPEGVEIIGAGAFADCYNIEVAVIPDSVISIEKGAFMNCDNLKEIVFGKESSLAEIGEGAFRDCASLEEMNIPKGVKSIGRYAFYCDNALVKFNYASSVEAWGAIEKGENWDVNTGDYTVVCTDGEMSKE